MKTIRARLTVISLAAAALGLSIGMWGLSSLGERLLTQQLRDDLRADARAIATAADAQAIDAAVAVVSPGRLAQVRTADGTILAASRHAIRQSQDLEEVEILPGTVSQDDLRTSGWTTGSSDLRALDAGWQAVTTYDERRGLQVTLAAPIADVHATVRTFTMLAAVGVPVLTALTGLLVWAVLGRALRPVDEARRRAADAGDVYPPPPLHVRGGGAEIDALVTTFEALLARAAVGVRTQRRFLANAAHELLSPLAVLRTNLELSLRQDPSPAVRRALQRCIQTQARLEALAQQLLALARAEDVDEPEQIGLDLAHLVNDVIQDVAPQHEARVALHAPARLEMLGDPTGLRQLIDNLVQNACRHANSCVAVSLVADRETVHLHVDDDGPGIPVAARQSVLAPFSRLRDARARTGGAGLGLAIVKAVAERHGGHVELLESQQGGARVSVAVPRWGLALAPSNERSPG